MTTISVMIPAYEEEKNLENAVDSVLNAMGLPQITDYEIIIFDDGSEDRTGEIADEIALSNPKIKVIHNETNMGFGYNYVKGVEMAKMEYYCLFPGDNENEGESFKEILSHIGEADMVLSYTSNMEVRKLKRRIISRIYTWLVNYLFTINPRIKYFNGINIYKTSLLREVGIDTYGFGFNVEIIIRMIRNGYSYIEVPAIIKPTAKSSALKISNINSVGIMLIKLMIEDFKGIKKNE